MVAGHNARKFVDDALLLSHSWHSVVCTLVLHSAVICYLARPPPIKIRWIASCQAPYPPNYCAHKRQWTSRCFGHRSVLFSAYHRGARWHAMFSRQKNAGAAVKLAPNNLASSMPVEPGSKRRSNVTPSSLGTGSNKRLKPQMRQNQRSNHHATDRQSPRQ